MKYRAVAFDIDGTLYPSLGLYLGHIGFGLRNYRILTTFSRVRHELHSLAMDPGKRKSLPRDLQGFRKLQASLLAERGGLGFEEAKDWIERVMYGELESFFATIRLFPGVEAALTRLSREGLRLAALSDFPAPGKLASIGLSRFFEIAMSSEESGMLKPAPEPFFDLAARLGLQSAEILYVGNSPSLDIAGAHGAGMDAALRGGGAIKKIIREPYAPRGADKSHSSQPELSFSNWNDLVSFALEGSHPRS